MSATVATVCAVCHRAEGALARISLGLEYPGVERLNESIRLPLCRSCAQSSRDQLRGLRDQLEAAGVPQGT